MADSKVVLITGAASGIGAALKARLESEGDRVISVDLRNADDRVLREAESRLSTFLEELAEMEGVTITTKSLSRFEPVDFDATMVDLVQATAERLGHSTRRMPSGAGHDAQMLARICPTAMVFTPSVNGLSHNIAEFTEAVDIEAGANVLLQVVLDQLSAAATS